MYYRFHLSTCDFDTTTHLHRILEGEYHHFDMVSYFVLSFRIGLMLFVYVVTLYLLDRVLNMTLPTKSNII